MITKGYPKYFRVDEVYIKVFEAKNGDLVAVNDLGSPAQPFKTMVDGVELTKKEFDKGVALRRKKHPIFKEPLKQALSK